MRPGPLLAIAALLVPGVYLFRDAEPADYVRVLVVALVALFVTGQLRNRRNGSGNKPPALVLACGLSLFGFVPGAANASYDHHPGDPVPEYAEAWANEMGLGDDFPPGALSTWSGFPCWQLRMEEDFEGFLKSVYGAGIGSLIMGAANNSAALALLQNAVAAAAVGGVVFASWEVLFASGCGACGEYDPFADWHVSTCGPLGIDCCVPPESIEPRKRRKAKPRDRAGIPKPVRPRWSSQEPISSGWQGAEDLVGCPGGEQDRGWDDDEEEECYDLSGPACDQLCPPRSPGECAVGCDTCGACIYSSC
ncbi:MAG: hypothetical protein CL928_04080 [Deltaproteobacteria bacterium]|nr:hypothetical protein [Deltaproteobacteria bacterium]